MTEKQTIQMIKKGMTVGELIDTLSKFDKNLPVVNYAKSFASLPVSDVAEKVIDFKCDDKRVTINVVSVY